MGERTGSRVFQYLWSYVAAVLGIALIKGKPEGDLVTLGVHGQHCHLPVRFTGSQIREPLQKCLARHMALFGGL